MSDSAELLLVFLLLSLAINQCGTCNHTGRIAEELERQGKAGDAGVQP